MSQIAFDRSGAETLRPPPLSDAPPVESGWRALKQPRHVPAARPDVGRMGMCVGIACDGVFFASLLGVAVTVQSAHPELFAYGRYYLNASLGVTESSVLLAGMLAGTLATALARRGALGALRAVLVATVFLGCAFLGLEALETSDMVGEGLLPGSRFGSTESVWQTPEFRAEHPDAARYAETFRVAPLPAKVPQRHRGASIAITRRGAAVEATTSLVGVGALGDHAVFPDVPSEPRNAHLFFGLFYLVTFVHALHVLVGIGVWGWLLTLTTRRASPAALATALDGASLYASFVALLRIAVFTLFYLA
jgi:cytochrome c oxidase subunit 3